MIIYFLLLQEWLAVVTREKNNLKWAAARHAENENSHFR